MRLALLVPYLDLIIVSDADHAALHGRPVVLKARQRVLRKQQWRGLAWLRTGMACCAFMGAQGAPVAQNVEHSVFHA